MQQQAKALAQRPHIVIGTPGRLRVSWVILFILMVSSIMSSIIIIIVIFFPSE